MGWKRSSKLFSLFYADWVILRVHLRLHILLELRHASSAAESVAAYSQLCDRLWPIKRFIRDYWSHRALSNGFVDQHSQMVRRRPPISSKEFLLSQNAFRRKFVARIAAKNESPECRTLFRVF